VLENPVSGEFGQLHPHLADRDPRVLGAESCSSGRRSWPPDHFRSRHKTRHFHRPCSELCGLYTTAIWLFTLKIVTPAPSQTCRPAQAVPATVSWSTSDDPRKPSRAPRVRRRADRAQLVLAAASPPRTTNPRAHVLSNVVVFFLGAGSWPCSSASAATVAYSPSCPPIYNELFTMPARSFCCCFSTPLSSGSRTSSCAADRLAHVPSRG